METLADKLNEFLANQTLLYTKLHNLHWYIEGPNFFTLHVQFETLYDTTAEMMDEVAERLLAIGEAPAASLQKVIDIATLAEREDKPVGASDAILVIIADLKSLEADSRQIIELAQQQKDEVTVDMFIGYLGQYQKTMWMMNAYLK